MTNKLSEIFEEFKKVYPTDEDPQGAFNDRLKEQKHGQNIYDRIASRNRGTLPKTIYDFINQIVGEVTTLQHHQGNAAQWAEEGRERHHGEHYERGHRSARSTRGTLFAPGPWAEEKTSRKVQWLRRHTWKECRNYEHEMFNPKEHVPYHITSMTAEAEKRYGKKRILLRFINRPNPLVTSVACLDGLTHPTLGRKVRRAVMRYRKGQPMEAPPGQSLGTRAAIVGDMKGEDPESRDPVTSTSAQFARHRSSRKSKDNADVSRPCLLLSWPLHA